MEGAGEKKKFTQLQELERSQEQHPIPERFPWRQVWQRTMRVRETDERGKEGKGRGRVGGGGWVVGVKVQLVGTGGGWGVSPLKRTVGSMMVL